ncbi:Thioredoxin-like fold [Globisporangium polare]
MSAPKTTICVVLTSSVVSVADQKSQMTQLLQLLRGKRIEFKEIDCSLDENKELRDFYFEKSQIRANYPQVFLQSPQETKYIGSFAEIEQLNEMCDIPKDILEANNIQTLETVFADVARRL